jgi:hypothetical protein
MFKGLPDNPKMKKKWDDITCSSDNAIEDDNFKTQGEDDEDGEETKDNNTKEENEQKPVNDNKKTLWMWIS